MSPLLATAMALTRGLETKREPVVLGAFILVQRHVQRARQLQRGTRGGVGRTVTFASFAKRIDQKDVGAENQK